MDTGQIGEIVTARVRRHLNEYFPGSGIEVSQRVRRKVCLTWRGFTRKYEIVISMRGSEKAMKAIGEVERDHMEKDLSQLMLFGTVVILEVSVLKTTEPAEVKSVPKVNKRESLEEKE
jgi:hypothetical protein